MQSETKQQAARLMAAREFRQLPTAYRLLVEDAITLLYAESPAEVEQVRSHVELVVKEH